jgi:hypothetical protein
MKRGAYLFGGTADISPDSFDDLLNKPSFKKFSIFFSK